MFTFKKNRAGAVTMALIMVVSGLAVTGAFGLFDLLTNPQPDIDIGLTIAAAVMLGVLFGGITTALIAVLIHDLDARHWGRKGAIRWLFVGLWYGVWWGLVIRVLPAIDNGILDRILHWGFQIAIIIWAYWLAFRIMPPVVNDDEPEA